MRCRRSASIMERPLRARAGARAWPGASRA
jgi:hypothetical protein